MEQIYYGGNDYRDYLAHHGILGMKWGKRQGPPYPLGVGDHSASEKKIGWRKSLNGNTNDHLYHRRRGSSVTLQEKWNSDKLSGRVSINKAALKKAMVVAGGIAVTGLVTYATYKVYKNGASTKAFESIIENTPSAAGSFKELLKKGKLSYGQVNDRLFDKKTWESFSDDEKEAVKAYTGYSFKYINKFLRGQPLQLWEKANALAYVDNCRSALDKCSLKKLTTTYRGCDVAGLESLFGGARLSSMNNTELKQFVGATVTEKGFFSTSPAIPFHGKVNISVICPPGTKALYVDPISINKGEKELLLQAGTSFEVCDIVNTATGGFNVVLKAIVENVI